MKRIAILIFGIGTSKVSMILRIDSIFSWISDITIILEEALLLVLETRGVNGCTFPRGVKTAPSVPIKSEELI